MHHLVLVSNITATLGKMTITADQCRAARGLIGIDQSGLAQASRVSRNTIASFESGQRTPGANNLIAIRATFEAAGVEFTNGTGVKRRKADFYLEGITPSVVRVRQAEHGHRYSFAIAHRKFVAGGLVVGDAPVELRDAARDFAAATARSLKFID
jgi:transcriptional regulator with XRE-family HTH domain